MAKTRKRRNKETTYEFVADKKQKAVDFLNRIGQEEAADKLEDESVESYGLRKGLVITNPKASHRKGRKGPQRKSAKKSISRRRNAGVGQQFMFHGSFKRKADAQKKESETPGAFIRPTKDGRYLVMSPKVANPKGPNRKGRKGTRRKAKRKTNVSRKGRFVSRKKKNVSRRRNPGEDYMRKASQLYKDFHGEDPAEITELTEEIEQNEDYAKLGDLISITLKDGYVIEFGDPPDDEDEEDESDLPILASDPDGNQLFVFGGDQDLSGLAEKQGLDDSKGMLDFGEIKKIDYFTRKHFHGFKPVVYTHTLGEDTHKRPRLMWDQDAEQIHIVGGEYTIKPEGIVN